MEIKTTLNLEIVLEYDNMAVVRSRKSGRFFFIEEGSLPKQVNLVASIAPSNHLEADDSTLASLFDNTVCGESIDANGNASYLYFR